MEEVNIKPKPETKNAKGKVKKKRKSNPSAWKCNIRKAAITHGQSYIRDDGTVAPAKSVGDFCKNCRLKCSSRISQDIRQQFFDRYYQISSLSEKRQFLLRYIKTVDVKRHRATDSNRKVSRTYFIGTGYWESGNETMIQVCQITFLNTLSISGKTVRAAYDRLVSSNGTSFEDLRGRFIRKSSEDLTEKQMTLAKDHVKTIPLVDEFIPRMYDLYCDYMRKHSAKPELIVSLDTYKAIYDEEFEMKLLAPKKKKNKPKQTKSVIEECDQKPSNIMTLEQYNETVAHLPCYEKTWMGSNATETKIGYVNYQIPVVKIEIEHEPQISEEKPAIKKKKTVKSSNANSDKTTKKSHPKKGTSDPSKWLRNIRKNANLHGLSYTKADGTVVAAKTMKDFCTNCRLNCQSKFDDSFRQQFFDRYYRLSSINEKYQFILRYTQTVDIKKRTAENSNRRKISRLYFIGTGCWENGSESKIQVCQTLFLNTLNISGKTVRTAYEKLWSTNGTSFEDLRGINKKKADQGTKMQRKARNPLDVTEEDFSTAKILANM